MNTDTEIYKEARARVFQLKLLYAHVGLYVIAMLAMLIVNALAEPDAQRGNWWGIYPAMAWGGVVLVHAILVMTGALGRYGIIFDRWEARKIEEIVREQKRHTAA